VNLMARVARIEARLGPPPCPSCGRPFARSATPYTNLGRAHKALDPFGCPTTALLERIAVRAGLSWPPRTCPFCGGPGDIQGLYDRLWATATDAERRMLLR
jgi:hypothetical protein